MEFNTDVLSKLKFIGKLEKGDKINVKSMYIHPEGLLTRLLRSFIYLDSRRNTLSFVKSTVTQSFNILYNLLSNENTSHKNMCINIIQDIRQSRKGIDNLKITYTADIMLCCQFECILQEIDSKLLDLSEKFPEIFKLVDSITLT